MWCVINGNNNYALLTSDKAINRIANNLIQIVLPKLIVKCLIILTLTEFGSKNEWTIDYYDGNNNSYHLFLASCSPLLCLDDSVIAFLFYYLTTSLHIECEFQSPQVMHVATEKNTTPVDTATLQTGNCILVSHL